MKTIINNYIKENYPNLEIELRNELSVILEKCIRQKLTFYTMNGNGIFTFDDKKIMEFDLKGFPITAKI